MAAPAPQAKSHVLAAKREYLDQITLLEALQQAMTRADARTGAVWTAIERRIAAEHVKQLVAKVRGLGARHGGSAVLKSAPNQDVDHRLLGINAADVDHAVAASTQIDVATIQQVMVPAVEKVLGEQTIEWARVIEASGLPREAVDTAEGRVRALLRATEQTTIQLKHLEQEVVKAQWHLYRTMVGVFYRLCLILRHKLDYHDPSTECQIRILDVRLAVFGTRGMKAHST